MYDYQIVTDATCDLNQDILDAYHLLVVPMYVTLDSGESFLHYPDFRNFAAEKFYAMIDAGKTARTTQITPIQYLEFFRPLLAEGKDILYICFSSGMSGTYQASVLALQTLREEFPERKIISVDSLCASGGEGMFAVQAALNAESGMTMEENEQWLLDHRLNLAHYFTVGDLDALKRGGRVSAAAAFVAGALNIKPILLVDDQGALAVVKKVRGRKASMRALIDMTKKTIRDSQNQVLYISYTACHDEAETLRQMVLAEIPCKDVILTVVGPVVGAHTGSSLLTLFSFGSERRPEGL